MGQIRDRIQTHRSSHAFYGVRRAKHLRNGALIIRFFFQAEQGLIQPFQVLQGFAHKKLFVLIGVHRAPLTVGVVAVLYTTLLSASCNSRKVSVTNLEIRSRLLRITRNDCVCASLKNRS
jgi:hypothetical protein